MAVPNDYSVTSSSYANKNSESTNSEYSHETAIVYNLFLCTINVNQYIHFGEIRRFVDSGSVLASDELAIYSKIFRVAWHQM